MQLFPSHSQIQWFCTSQQHDPEDFKQLGWFAGDLSHDRMTFDANMIHKQYLSSCGWVDDGSNETEFEAYLDARHRCILRGRPYLLRDDETGATLSVLTVKQCLNQSGMDGDFAVGQDKPNKT